MVLKSGSLAPASLYPYSVLEYPVIDLKNHYAQSFTNLDRVPAKKLRAFSRTIPGDRAIRRISDGVLAMPLTFLPPEDLTNDADALHRCHEIRRSLLRPNQEPHQNRQSLLYKACIKDVMTLGFAAVERQQGNGVNGRRFWLTAMDALHVRQNREWTPQNTDTHPLYVDRSARPHRELMQSECFLIQQEASTFELVPPSPLEVAFRMIEAWLGLNDFQQRTTSKAVRDYILFLQEAVEDDVKTFRAYWKNDVVEEGETPIVGGKGLDVKKLGAKNDEELYPLYCEYQLRIIALALGLTPRDFNIREPDNKSTAGEAANATFQNAVRPLAITFREVLEIEVVDFYESGFRVKLTDTEPRGEKEEAEIAGQLFKDGIITKNQALIRVGEKPIGPQGDVFFDGTKLEAEDKLPAGNTPNRQSQPRRRRANQDAASSGAPDLEAAATSSLAMPDGHEQLQFFLG